MSEGRAKLRYAIEEAIEAWRDGSDNDGTLHLYEPDEVKELARAIRDRLITAAAAEKG